MTRPVRLLLTAGAIVVPGALVAAAAVAVYRSLPAPHQAALRALPGRAGALLARPFRRAPAAAPAPAAQEQG